jgi:hypothetical protein
MEYLFVFAKGGWWLKLDSIEKLIDYHQKTGTGKFENALLMYLNEGRPEEILENLSLEGRIEKMNNRDFKYLQGAVMQAEKNHGSIIDGFRWLNMEIGMNQMENIRQYGAVYINPVGGHTYLLEYTQFCRRKELVFPDYSQKDIRVKQFNGGTHYYVHIGDLEVRDGDVIKWNSYEEAYGKALAILEG